MRISDWSSDVCSSDLVLGYLLVPESSDPARPRLDPVGAVLSIAGLTALLWAVIEAPSQGWGAGSVAAAFVAGGVLLALFMVWRSEERRVGKESVRTCGYRRVTGR